MPKDEVRIETASTKVVKKKPKLPAGTLVGATPSTPSPSPSATTVSSISKIPPPKSTLPLNSITSSNAQAVAATVMPSENSGGIPVGSTNKPTTTANANVQQSNLHNLIMPQQTNNSQLPTSSGSSSFLVNQPMINTVSIPSQQPAKVKKGVKRKADTTTPTGFNDSAYPSADSKVSTRGRQVDIIILLPSFRIYTKINFLFFFLSSIRTLYLIHQMLIQYRRQMYTIVNRVRLKIRRNSVKHSSPAMKS